MIGPCRNDCLSSFSDGLEFFRSWLSEKIDHLDGGKKGNKNCEPEDPPVKALGGLLACFDGCQ